MLALTILKSEGLDWLCQRLGPWLPWTKYGGNKLWLIGCLGSEPRLALADWRYATMVRRLGEAAASGWGEYVPCADFSSNTLAFALQLRKITENRSQGNRRALGCSAPNAIRLVDLAISGDGLDWPAVPCRSWLSRQATGSTLGQFKYLPSCRTRGFPTSANFESKLSVRLWCGWQTAERPDTRVSACYLRTKGHQ